MIHLLLLCIKKDKWLYLSYFLSTLSLSFFLWINFVPVADIAYSIFLFSFPLFLYKIWNYHIQIKKINRMAAACDFSVFSDFNDLPIQSGYEQKLLEFFYDHQLELFESEQKRQDLYNIQVQRTMRWAHQIKIPISTMKLYLHQEDSELSRELQIQLFRIEQYVKTMMWSTRLNSKSNDYRFEKVNLKELVTERIQQFSRLFLHKKLHLHLDLNPLLITSDRKWLGFVLDLLIDNAIKYTNQGTISIYIKQNKLYIEDTGIGIQSEDLHRIFEESYTGFNGHINDFSSGLGLFYCKEVLSRLHHSIQVRSKVNEGSIFIIDFSNSIENIPIFD